MKVFWVLLSFLVSCHGQQLFSTPSPAPNTTSHIEKEGEVKPNVKPPVRSMPFTNYPSNPSNPQGQNTGNGEVARIPRTGFQAPSQNLPSSRSNYGARGGVGSNSRYPQEATESPRQGGQDRASGDVLNAQQNPPQRFGYRSANQILPQPNVYREEENGYQSATRRSQDIPRNFEAPIRNVPSSEPNQGLGSPVRNMPELPVEHRGPQSGVEERGVALNSPGSVVPGFDRRINPESDIRYRVPSSTAGIGYQRPPYGQQDGATGFPRPGIAGSIPLDNRVGSGAGASRDGLLSSGDRSGDSDIPTGGWPRLGANGPWTSYRRTGMGGEQPGVLYGGSEDHEHRPFSFNYVSESDEGMHSHQQTADGSGKVIGSYALALGDGRRRIVEYIADENGFRASIDSNEPGTSFNENPADVVYYSGRGGAAPSPNFRGLQNTQDRGQSETSRARGPAASTRDGSISFPTNRRLGEQPTDRYPGRSSQETPMSGPSDAGRRNNIDGPRYGLPATPGAGRRLADTGIPDASGSVQPQIVPQPEQPEQSYRRSQANIVPSQPTSYDSNIPFGEYGSSRSQSNVPQPQDDDGNRSWFRRY